MDVIGGELGFMAASAGKASLTLMEPHRLMFVALGCIMGLVLGIIPGIGGLTGTAMLLAFTFNMDPYAAFALLLGLGATTATGDPIPAILFGVPGGAASAATVLDGFPMAKRGEAGRALSAAYMSSLMGGIFGAALLAVSIPILRPVMLYLGSPELLAFSILGISMVAVLSGSAPLRGVAAGCLGVMIAMIGSDPQGGALVPTIAFGVPGSATMAILLGAFLIHGLVPGPDMLHKNLDITYAMVWSVALANILGAGACYAFSPQFARLATLRYTLILPAVLSIVYIGAFEASRSWGDLFALLIFGVFGWLMKQFKWPRPPLVLGLVLGDSIERYMFISI